jgi:Tol biopolymer transport system component
MLWIGVCALSWNAVQAQVTQRASVGPNWMEANSWSAASSISADGRFVAFSSWASNLVDGDTNAVDDVFVRDLLTNTTERVSVTSTGEEANDRSSDPVISGDGRFVVFWSAATNLVPGDLGDIYDVFIRDRALGTTEKISVDSNGLPGDADSMSSSISPDGRFVTFRSWADNLDPAHGANGYWHVYLRDRQLQTTELVDMSSLGVTANFDSNMCSSSADSRFIVFDSMASNLVPGDTWMNFETFLRDRLLGTTERVDLAWDGTPSNGLQNFFRAVSDDGRFVAFGSDGTNLVPDDTNGWSDVFVRDRVNATTERVSISFDGTEGNWNSGLETPLMMTPDARFIVFQSRAWNLVAGDHFNGRDLFLRDRTNGTTEQLSVSSGGGQVPGDSFGPSVSPDGRFIAFLSNAAHLIPFDTNGFSDVFVRDRLPGSGTNSFTSLCDPGIAGVIGCPCSNPPAGPGSGCDNSAATGGAILSASGITGVLTDGLTFRTSGEPSSALSILAQGNSAASGGIVYGQGVRCAMGGIRRLYTKPAVAGAVLVPNLPNGDVQVSVRSAATGDRILAGQSRWYFVFYRDPVVLGDCPANSTFNVTQTGRIDWSL